MIYLAFNLAITIFLISRAIKIRSEYVVNGMELVYTIIIGILCTIVVEISILLNALGFLNLYSNYMILESIALWLLGLVHIQLAFYFITFAIKRNILVTLTEIIFAIFAAYLLIFKIRLNLEGFRQWIDLSKLLVNGHWVNFSLIQWYSLYYTLFFVVLPHNALIFTLLYAENNGYYLLFQRATFFYATLGFNWVGMVALMLMSYMLPMTHYLTMVVVGIMLALNARFARTDKVQDGSALFSIVVLNTAKYGVPSFFGAIVFVKFFQFFKGNPLLYFAAVFAAVMILIVLSRILVLFGHRLAIFDRWNYESRLEAELAIIDYTKSTAVICNTFFQALRKHARIDTMSFSVLDSNHELSTLYSSSGEKMTISMDEPGIRTLLDAEIRTLLREKIESEFPFVEQQEELYTLFSRLNADAVVILSQKRYFIGLIILHGKTSTAKYDDYDAGVFEKLYPYFFVYGYYMRNLATRETNSISIDKVKASSGIVRTIQNTIGTLDNPRIDVGHLVVPAQDVGGEFVDVIRLTNTSAMFIIGGLNGMGSNAGVNMAVFKSMVRNFISTTSDFKTIVAKLNVFVKNNMPKGTLFSGLFCLMDFATDTLYYINCGIPIMALYSERMDNSLELQGNGYVLGFANDISQIIKVKQLKIKMGDIIVATTNGIITSSAIHAGYFGKSRIKKLISDTHTKNSSREMVEAMYKDLRRFVARELDKDITILMLRYVS